MTVPVRIQRRRIKGWRLPEGARYVGRPTIWGNPFPVGSPMGYSAEFAVEDFRRWFTDWLKHDPYLLGPLRHATALACWCPLDQPCHADVLIELVRG